MPAIYMGDNSAPEFVYIAGAIYRHRSHATHDVYYYLCVKNDFDDNTRNKFSFICINNNSHNPKAPAITLVDCLKNTVERRGVKSHEPMVASGNLTMVARLSEISWEE